MKSAQSLHNPDLTGTQTERSRPSGLDALQAVLLLTAHLTDVLPLLTAVVGVPSGAFERITLLEGMAKRVVADRELVREFYDALGLLAGRDITALSVADLILLSKDLLEGPALGEIWRAAYAIGLLNEDLVARWVLYDSLTGG